MLINYPAPNWNTFLPLADIITSMEFQFPDKAVEFKLLTVEKQNSVIANAGMWIRTCKGLTIPNPVAQDIVLAQVAIVASRYTTCPLAHDPHDRAITKEKVGEVEVDYDPKYKGDNLDINPLIYRLLSPYGCTGNTGFSQSPTRKA